MSDYRLSNPIQKSFVQTPLLRKEHTDGRDAQQTPRFPSCGPRLHRTPQSPTTATSRRDIGKCVPGHGVTMLNQNG
jgi:hypothetical protein